jgi:hypothetical protein
MANSKQQLRGQPVAPIGFVPVPSPGTPVSLMSVLDPSNNNAPTTATGPQTTPYGSRLEYPTSCRGIAFQGYKQGGNGSPVFNAGAVYIMVAAAGGGSGNNIDMGAMIKVLQPGQDFFYPPPDANLDRFSPYYLYLDADNAGDGALVVAYSVSGG